MKRRGSGFTLVELMIAVAIVGILASVAMPTYTGFIRRARVSEAYEHIDTIKKGVIAYYNSEHTVGSSSDAASAAHCVTPWIAVRPTGGWDAVSSESYVPDASGATPQMQAVSFNPTGPLYFSYLLMTVNYTVAAGVPTQTGDQCGHTDEPALAFIWARSDLDDNGDMGVVHLNLASRNGEVYSGPGIRWNKEY